MASIEELAYEKCLEVYVRQSEQVIEHITRPQWQEAQFAQWDGVSCFDCGEDLIEERLHLGRVRCVDCQSLAEHKEKRSRGL